MRTYTWYTWYWSEDVPLRKAEGIQMLISVLPWMLRLRGMEVKKRSLSLKLHRQAKGIQILLVFYPEY